MQLHLELSGIRMGKVMRYSQAGKMEIIRLVEGSDLGVRATVKESDVCRGSFYSWYQSYREAGYD